MLFDAVGDPAEMLFRAAGVAAGFFLGLMAGKMICEEAKQSA